MLNIGFIIPYTENNPHYYMDELNKSRSYENMCEELSFLDLRDLSIEKLNKSQLLQAMSNGVNFINMIGIDTIWDFHGVGHIKMLGGQVEFNASSYSSFIIRIKKRGYNFESRDYGLCVGNSGRLVLSISGVSIYNYRVSYAYKVDRYIIFVLVIYLRNAIIMSETLYNKAVVIFDYDTSELVHASVFEKKYVSSIEDKSLLSKVILYGG